MKRTHARRKLTLNERKNISEKLKGRKKTEEHKRNMSLGRINMKFTYSHKKNLSSALKNRKLSPSHVRNCALGRLGTKRSQETKDKMRASALKRISEGRVSKKMFDTVPELKFEQILKKKCIAFKKQHHVSGVTIADFYIPESNTLVFIDGCYWHSCPICYDKEVRCGVRRIDSVISNKCKKLGYRVLRIWEHQLNSKHVKIV